MNGLCPDTRMGLSYTWIFQRHASLAETRKNSVRTGRVRGLKAGMKDGRFGPANLWTSQDRPCKFAGLQMRVSQNLSGSYFSILQFRDEDTWCFLLKRALISGIQMSFFAIQHLQLLGRQSHRPLIEQTSFV